MKAENLKKTEKEYNEEIILNRIKRKDNEIKEVSDEEYLKMFINGE